jgi:hypothetical protein
VMAADSRSWSASWPGGSAAASVAAAAAVCGDGSLGVVVDVVSQHAEPEGSPAGQPPAASGRGEAVTRPVQVTGSGIELEDQAGVGDLRAAEAGQHGIGGGQVRDRRPGPGGVAEAPEEALGGDLGARLAHVVCGDPAVMVRRCQAAACSRFYVDESRNRSRRFCSNACASRTTVAAHRARLKHAESG